MIDIRYINAGAVYAERFNSIPDIQKRYTINGSPSITNSPFGKAMTFDGSTDYLTIPVSFTNNLNGASAITVVTRLKASSISSSNVQRVYRLYVGAANSVGPELYFQNGNLYAGGRGSAADGYQTSAAYAFDTTYYHTIATVYNISGDKIQVYIDGSLQIDSSVTFTSTAIDKTNTTSDIISPIIFSTGFNGILSELVIFPRALSTQEISDISTNKAFDYDKNLVSKWDAGINPVDTGWRNLANSGTGVNLDSTNIVDGPYGKKAINFNGSDENVITGNAASLVFDNNSKFSFGCVVKWNGAPSGNYPQIIDAGDSSGPNRNYRIGTWTTTREVFVEFMSSLGSPNWRTFRTGILLDDGAWNIVFAAWSAYGIGSTKYLNVYVINASGINTYSTTTTSDWISTAGYVAIGKSISNNTFFNGSVSCPMIFDTALTQIQVKDLYNRIREGRM